MTATQAMFRGKVITSTKDFLIVKGENHLYRIDRIRGQSFTDFKDFNGKKVKVTIELEED